MNRFTKRDMSDFTDDELFSLVINPRGISVSRIREIVEELEERGRQDEVRQLEQDLIRSKPLYARVRFRFFAYIIDCIILAIFGSFLGIFFSTQFTQMGTNGMWVGFVTALLYFGLGNSQLFNGQTIGKRLFKIRVVTKEFNLLAVPKSIIRALVYVIPYVFINYQLGTTNHFLIWLQELYHVAFPVFLIVLLVHVIINKASKQSLSDLLVGTYVINIDAYPRQSFNKACKRTAYIPGAISLFIVVLILSLTHRQVNSDSTLADLRQVNEEINSLDQVLSSSISLNVTNLFGTDKEEETEGEQVLEIHLVPKEKVNLVLDASKIKELDFVKETIGVVLTKYQKIDGIKDIRIVIIKGYDIGICKSSISHSLSLSVREWRENSKQK